MASDFWIDRGNSRSLLVTVKDSMGANVPLTADTKIRWSLAVNENSTPLIEKDNLPGGNGGVTYNSADRFTVEIEPDDTVSLNAARYYHEAEIETEDGKIYTVLKGHVTIRPTLL